MTATERLLAELHDFVPVRETSISREKARRIMEECDGAAVEDFDPAGDYYLAWDAQGREALIVAGRDPARPEAWNHTTMSWL